MEAEDKERFFSTSRVVRIFIYFLGIFVLKGASLILTPLYTHVFTTDQYGTIELANSITAFLSNIISLGLCQYLGIEYFHLKDRERTAAVEKNIILYLMISTPAIILFFILNFAGMLSFTTVDKLMLFFVGINTYLAYFSGLCLMLCKNQQKTNLMTVIQFIVGIMTLVLNYCGIIVLGWNIYSTLITTAITGMVFVIILPFVYKFDVSIRGIQFSKSETNLILRISIPLAITSIVNSVLLLGDRWILNYFCSTSEIGIYSLCTKIGSIFELVLVNTLTIFYAPNTYKNFQENGMIIAEKKNRKIFWVYIIIAILMALTFIALIHWVFPLLIDNRYAESEKYLWIVLVGDIFIGATYFRTYLVNYYKKTKYILYMNVAAMVFNILANLLFIPKFQIWAAAWTTASSYVLMFIIAEFVNHNLMRKLKNENNIS